MLPRHPARIARFAWVCRERTWRFNDTMKKAGSDHPGSVPKCSVRRAARNAARGESEPGDSLGESAHLAAGGVLVEHSAGDSARQFGLRVLERALGGLLVPACDRALDFLHEAADAAHARPVDLGTLVVAADALLGLRRIGHVRPCLGPPSGRPDSVV